MPKNTIMQLLFEPIKIKGVVFQVFVGPVQRPSSRGSTRGRRPLHPDHHQLGRQPLRLRLLRQRDEVRGTEKKRTLLDRTVISKPREKRLMT